MLKKTKVGEMFVFFESCHLSKYVSHKSLKAHDSVNLDYNHDL